MTKQTFELSLEENFSTQLYKGKTTWGFGKNKIEITDMTEKHLENSMGFLLSSIPKLKGKYADKAKKRKDSSSITDANYIWGLPNREFLCEFTEFGLLAREHAKRQIDTNSAPNKWESIDKEFENTNKYHS